MAAKPAVEDEDGDKAAPSGGVGCGCSGSPQSKEQGDEKEIISAEISKEEEEEEEEMNRHVDKETLKKREEIRWINQSL